MVRFSWIVLQTVLYLLVLQSAVPSLRNHRGASARTRPLLNPGERSRLSLNLSDDGQFPTVSDRENTLGRSTKRHYTYTNHTSDLLYRTTDDPGSGKWLFLSRVAPLVGQRNILTVISCLINQASQATTLSQTDRSNTFTMYYLIREFHAITVFLP